MLDRDEIRAGLKEEMIPRLRALMTRVEENPSLIEWPLAHPALARVCIMVDIELLQAISYVLAFFEPEKFKGDVQK